MPRGIYSKIICTGKKEPVTGLDHQKKTVSYFLKSPFKGLLLFHELGSGKTCTAIMVADAMLKKNLITRVFIFSPGSLRQTWINEYCKKCGASPETMKEKYTFITYNYDVGERIPNLTGGLVIIDEVHNLINGVKNQSKTASAIYEKIDKSKCRVLALSGTPVFNEIGEFNILSQLLKPGNKRPPVLSLFNTKEDGSLVAKNPKVAKAFFTGIISYFPGAGSEYVPTVQIMDPIKVVMSPEQTTYYFERNQTEQKLMIKPNESLLKKDPKEYYKKMRLYIMARKRTLTRSASNFLQLVPGKPDLPEEEGGWITDDLFSKGQLLTYSRKFVALFLNIIYNFNQKHVVFTFFKKKGGASLIQYLLEKCGIKVLLFTGDQTDAERAEALRKFNDPSNRYGEKYKVLIVTEAGAEGISVLEARHMHILESSPRVYKTIQAIGRVARFKSHDRLPLEEREIKVWRYWSIVNPEKPTTVKYEVLGEDGELSIKKQKIDPTTVLVDEELYKEGEKNIVKIKSFLNILKRNSVL